LALKKREKSLPWIFDMHDNLTTPGKKTLDHRLLREDPERALDLLASMEPAVQARLILSLRGRDRLALLQMSDRMQELVRLLPAPELWLTLKEVGEEDGLELLKAAAPEQLQHCLDLECWHLDMIDPLATAYWLMLLCQAGPGPAIAWFHQADEEFLIASLTRYFSVYKTDPDDEGNEPWRELENVWTLDDVYYLHFPDSNAAVIVQQFLSFVRALEPERYYGLLDLVERSVTIEQEEEAHRLRMARLADYGFVEPDEALEIYAPLSDHALAEMERGAGGCKAEAVKAGPYPLALREPGGLLREALARIEDPEALMDLELGLAALVNRILIADQMSLNSLENIQAAVAKAHAFVDLGLARWSAGEIERAVALLAAQHPIHLFRAGFTDVLALGRQAHRQARESWLGRTPLGLELLEDDGRLIAGLQKPRPRFHQGADDQGAPMYREFQTADEVARARLALARSEALGRLFFEALGLRDPELALLKEYRFGLDLAFTAILNTALAHALLGPALAFAPLTVVQAREALAKMFTPDLPHRLLPDLESALAPQLLDRFRRLASPTESDHALVSDFLASSLRRLEAEITNLDLAKLDPRYLAAIVIAPEK
jgi:hypothetical protein